MFGKKVLLLCFVFVLLAFSQAMAVELKDYANPAYGYKISLPAKWDPKPIGGKNDSHSGIYGKIHGYIAEEKVVPLHLLEGPQGCEFRLFYLNVKERDAAETIVNEYAEMKEFGAPNSEEEFKVKCTKTKVKRWLYKEVESGFFEEGMNAHYYFLAENPNGFFFYFFKYFMNFKKYETDIMESAKTFAFIEKKADKAAKPTSDIPPGGTVIKTTIFDIILADAKNSSLKSVANHIIWFDKAFSSIVPLDKAIEAKRPQGLPRQTVRCNFVSDTSGGAFGGESQSMQVYYEPFANLMTIGVRGRCDDMSDSVYENAIKMCLADRVGSTQIMIHKWVSDGLGDYLYHAGMEANCKAVFGELNQNMRKQVKDKIKLCGEPQLSQFIEALEMPTIRDMMRDKDYTYWALVYFLLKSNNKIYKGIIPKYICTIQKESYPLVSEMNSLDFSMEEYDKYLESRKGKEEGEGEDEEVEKKFKRYMELKEQCSAVSKTAMTLALAGIDQAKLQKELTEYFK